MYSEDTNSKKENNKKKNPTKHRSPHQELSHRLTKQNLLTETPSTKHPY